MPANNNSNSIGKKNVPDYCLVDEIMFRVIIQIARVILGSIGIIMAILGTVLLIVGILAITGERQNPKLLETAITELKSGAIMALVGFPLFGICAGALKRPLYFLVPIILILSFVLAGILLPEIMWGVKGEGAALAALALTIVAFRFINRYYAKREQDNGSVVGPS